MDKELYRNLKRLHARVDQVEEYCNEISSYIYELEKGLHDKDETVAKQINSFMKLTTAKIEEIGEILEDKE